MKVILLNGSAHSNGSTYRALSQLAKTLEENDIDTNNKKAEFGIFIGEDLARGKGIGTESTILTIKYGFEELKLHKIFLRVFANNYSAIKAYEKAGFIYEGTAKDDIMLPNGEFQDIVFMSIINK